MGGEKMLAAGLRIGSSKLAIALSAKGISIAATGAFGKILTALGGFGGPLGAAAAAVVGFVVGKILEKIDWTKVKRFFKENGGIFAIALLGGGAFLGSVPLATAGVLALGAGLVTSGGASAFGAATLASLGILGAAIIIRITKPVIITLITIPIAVAIILLIINSGAYVVPPTGKESGANPYIQIEKVANPTGPFENSDLPLSIEYSIKVSAKKGPLTNIVFSDTCQVITEGGTKECPSELPIDVPSEISPSSPYTFSYGSSYSGPNYKDSLIVNTLTVQADTVDGSQQSIATASIRIGDPPDSCPNDSWPIAGDGGLNDVTQGPSAPGCSHKNLNNAIDIGVLGATVVAVNSGVVTVGQDSCVGKYIKITSSCGSTTFSALYGHLGVVSVKNGQAVTLGQTLGITDNTGSCTSGPHLHFEFQTASIPIVQTPYLKRNVPIRCCTRSSCNP
jgi:murein DD-endopeptidase MepM/ murein hydrolase activator NlpD